MKFWKWFINFKTYLSKYLFRIFNLLILDFHINFSILKIFWMRWSKWLLLLHTGTLTSHTFQTLFILNISVFFNLMITHKSHQNSRTQTSYIFLTTSGTWQEKSSVQARILILFKTFELKIFFLKCWIRSRNDSQPCNLYK